MSYYGHVCVGSVCIHTHLQENDLRGGVEVDGVLERGVISMRKKGVSYVIANAKLSLK